MPKTVKNECFSVGLSIIILLIGFLLIPIGVISAHTYYLDKMAFWSTYFLIMPYFLVTLGHGISSTTLNQIIKELLQISYFKTFWSKKIMICFLFWNKWKRFLGTIKKLYSDCLESLQTSSSLTFLLYKMPLR